MSLLGFGPVDGQGDRQPFTVLGGQGLRLAPPVVLDQPVGRAEDVLRAPVVPFELHDLAAGEFLFEFEDVAQVRPAPAIDGLVGVSGDAEVGSVDAEGPDDGVLGQVRILIFIDEDVTEPGIEVGPDVGVSLEDGDNVDQQVVEVDGRGGLEPLLVAGVDLGRDRLDVIPRSLGQGLRRDQVVLGPADRRVDPLGRDRGVLQVELLHRVLDRAEAVGLVEDREPPVDPDQRSVRPEEPGAEAVERPDPDARARD